jgi:hypothetical protein
MSTPEKLTASFRFRVGPSFQKKVDRLSRQSRWDNSDIIRTGLEHYWPEIEALVLFKAGRSPVDSDTLRTVAEAQRLGINVEAELTAILQRAQGPTAA